MIFQMEFLYETGEEPINTDKEILHLLFVQQDMALFLHSLFKNQATKDEPFFLSARKYFASL